MLSDEAWQLLRWTTDALAKGITRGGSGALTEAGDAAWRSTDRKTLVEVDDVVHEICTMEEQLHTDVNAELTCSQRLPRLWRVAEDLT